MASYKLIGQRNLRTYTAARTSPTYAAASDAALIVDSLCDHPWRKTARRDAGMTYHTDENVGTKEEPVSGLDRNVEIRDTFDAALFCAGHVGGQHRAYANAAVYHYALPEGTLPRMTRLVATVTSDPYNSGGARIAVLTNSTGEIPTSCNACRTGDAHADGVAPRTVGANGNWFPTVADCVFSAEAGEGETALPTGGLQLQRHLYVFVLLESYSTVRGNWLEGCSYIRNLVRIETDAPVPGWEDGATIDLAAGAASSLAVLRGGMLPYVPGGACVGERHVSVRTDANLVVETDGAQTPIRQASEGAAASALGRAYAAFYAGDGDTPAADGRTASPGATFNVFRTVEMHVAERSDVPVETEVVRIDSAALVVPFAYPRDAAAARLVIAFAAPATPPSPGARLNVLLADDYLLALTGDQLKNPGLYDGEGSPFRLLGIIEQPELAAGKTATFALPETDSRVGTVVITGWFPPEGYNLSADGRQGTGPVAFMPDITITE